MRFILAVPILFYSYKAAYAATTFNSLTIALANATDFSNKLNNTISAWDGTAVGAIGVYQAHENMNSAINITIGIAQKSTDQYNTSQTDTTYDNTVKLEESIKNTLNNYNASYARFKSISFVGVVYHEINTTKTDSDQLLLAIANDVNDPYLFNGFLLPVTDHWYNNTLARSSS